MTLIKFINISVMFKFFVKICLLLSFCSVIYMQYDYTHWNGINKYHDRTLLSKFLNRLYFSSTTLSTVGYGDISPKSDSNKLITIFIHIIILTTVVQFIRIDFF